MKKRSVSILIVAGLVLGLSIPAYADEWRQDSNGWYYVYDNGEYARSGIVTIGDTNYFFSREGYSMIGWLAFNGDWYYADGSGALAAGWRQIDGKWYYFNDTNNRMVTGMTIIKSRYYYLGEDGAMKMGTFEADGVWYNADPATGVIVRNKRQKIAGTDKRIKYDDEGTLLTYNENKKQWEAVLDRETYRDSMMDLLLYDYSEGKYSSEQAFVADATTKLQSYLTQIELDEFITEVVMHNAPEDYEYNDDVYDDDDYYDEGYDDGYYE